MVLPNTWSRRKREATKAASGVADVYRYDQPSGRLREQLRQLIKRYEIIVQSFSSQSLYKNSVTMLREELGRKHLVGEYFNGIEEEFDLYITKEGDIDNWLTGLEIATRVLISIVARSGRSRIGIEFVEVLNARMLEDDFGFQFEGGMLIQISDEFSHVELIVPALNLLVEPRFAGANSEFRQAHAEFRAGEYEDCIHDCCNAFESVLKVILAEKGWSYLPTDPAKKLLDVAFTNNLVPSHMQSSFAGLRTILESGVPTVRNKSAAHGTGAEPRNIPKYIAAFQLHQTAAAILLLASAAR